MENRKHTRFTVDTSGIIGKMLFGTEVRILDLSLGGALLKSRRRFEIGREYSLKLERRDDILSLKGVIVWSVLRGSMDGPHGRTVPLYEAGIGFSGLSHDALLELGCLINEAGLDEAQESRSHRHRARASLPAQEKAVMNDYEKYTLKKLSLSAMLIESGCELEVGKGFPMEISLPGNKQISFWGKVTFCIKKSSKRADTFAVGMEFMDMSASDAERLRKYLNALLRSKKQDSIAISVGSRTTR